MSQNRSKARRAQVPSNAEDAWLALHAWKFEMTLAIEEFDHALEPFYTGEGDLEMIAGYRAPVHGTKLWHRVLRILRANPTDLIGANANEIVRPWETALR